MMSKKRYILLDNLDYLHYFLSGLKGEYIAIAADVYIESYLKLNKIPNVGILEYLSDADIVAITEDASTLVDAAIASFDSNNRRLYEEIFGRKDANVIYASMNYLFKRFVIGAFRFIRGLEAIIEQESMAELYYPHSEKVVNLCGNRMQNAFFFPSNISWNLLECWNYSRKPHLSLLEIKQKNSRKINFENNFELRTIINKAKGPLRNIRDFFRARQKGLSSFSSRKSNLLFITPLYDLNFALSSQDLREAYNIIIWNVDENSRPEFLKNHPQAPFFSDNGRQKEINYSEAEVFLKGFSYDNHILKSPSRFNINLNNFFLPLIKRFLEVKSPSIINYWKTAESLHKTIEIHMLLWGNSPHRYPGGIVKEFFRLNQVPILGMQHGGVTGSNYMGKSIFDLDLNHCDYYLSYGFDSSIFNNAENSGRKLPETIPVGSVLISDFANRINAVRHQKQKVKLIYPVAVRDDNIFMGCEFAIPRLFRLEQEIIDVLAEFHKSKIILKFFYNQYKRHYLKPYIEKFYPGRFHIIDNISFQKCLELFDAEIIVLAQQSTSLLEAVATGSNIIVYNDPLFTRLTDEALRLLKRMAVVCGDRRNFLAKVKSAMHGDIDFPDPEDKEFLKKFCIFNGDPKPNIINAISRLL